MCQSTSTTTSDLIKKACIVLSKPPDTTISFYDRVSGAHADLTGSTAVDEDDQQPPAVPPAVSLADLPSLISIEEYLSYEMGDLFHAERPRFGRTVAFTEDSCVVLIEASCHSTRRSSACYRPSGGYMYPQTSSNDEDLVCGFPRQVGWLQALMTDCRQPVLLVVCVSSVSCTCCYSSTCCCSWLRNLVASAAVLTVW